MLFVVRIAVQSMQTPLGGEAEGVALAIWREEEEDKDKEEAFAGKMPGVAGGTPALLGFGREARNWGRDRGWRGPLEAIWLFGGFGFCRAAVGSVDKRGWSNDIGVDSTKN